MKSPQNATPSVALKRKRNEILVVRATEAFQGLALERKVVKERQG